jgi:hypothetical protein
VINRGSLFSPDQSLTLQIILDFSLRYILLPYSYIMLIIIVVVVPALTSIGRVEALPHSKPQQSAIRPFLIQDEHQAQDHKEDRLQNQHRGRHGDQPSGYSHSYSHSHLSEAVDSDRDTDNLHKTNDTHIGSFGLSEDVDVDGGLRKKLLFDEFDKEGKLQVQGIFVFVSLLHFNLFKVFYSTARSR